MVEARKAPSRHRITLEHRERATITGVLDVVSFDEACIIADTEQGIVVVRGEKLHVSVLNLESGQIDLDGSIDSLTYDEPGHRAKGKSAFFTKLFR